jgi:hypothetical protein
MPKKLNNEDTETLPGVGVGEAVTEASEAVPMTTEKAPVKERRRVAENPARAPRKTRVKQNIYSLHVLFDARRCAAKFSWLERLGRAKGHASVELASDGRGLRASLVAQDGSCRDRVYPHTHEGLRELLNRFF